MTINSPAWISMIRAGVAQDDLKRTTTYSYRLQPKPSGRPASCCRLRNRVRSLSSDHV